VHFDGQPGGVANAKDTDVRPLARDAPDVAPFSIMLQLATQPDLRGAQLFDLGVGGPDPGIERGEPFHLGLRRNKPYPYLRLLPARWHR
jgi:hypothetical protein